MTDTSAGADEPAYVEECSPELIDGQYYGCGACEPCRDQADGEEED
ncbi:hypothetical protein [Nonomuraea sp. NPDC023979]